MTVPSQSVPAASPDGAPKLKRSMGLWMATALVVGNMIGSGVFLLPATLAGTAGPISMLGWLFTGAGFFWPIFPILGWGIGLVFHAWDVYWRKPISEEQIRHEMEHMA